MQFLGAARGEGSPDIGGPFRLVQLRLGCRGPDAVDQFCVDRYLRGAAEMAGQAFGLVEFALPFLGRMQRHGNDQVPLLVFEGRHSLANQQIGQERFKPERVRVFVAVDGFQHDRPGDDGGYGCVKR